MKKKNIAFSGFMAAILLSAGAANAATEIASKKFVENQVAGVSTNLTENYYNKTDTDTAISTAVTNATTADDGAVKKITDALDEKIDAVKNSVPTSETMAKKADKVDGVTEANAGGIATVAAGGNYEMSTTKLSDLAKQSDMAAAQSNITTLQGTVAEHTTTINSHSETITKLPGTIKETVVKELGGEGTEGVKETIEKTIVEQLNTEGGQLATAIDGKLDDKADLITVTAEQAGNIATVDANGQYGVGTIKATDLATKDSVTTAIADAVKSNGAIDTAVGTKITAELDTDGAITGAIDTAISDSVKEDGAVYTTMIPRPKDGECSGDSDMCVLSVDKKTGALTWVNVTNPLE